MVKTFKNLTGQGLTLQIAYTLTENQPVLREVLSNRNLAKVHHIYKSQRRPTAIARNCLLSSLR